MSYLDTLLCDAAVLQPAVQATQVLLITNFINTNDSHICHHVLATYHSVATRAINRAIKSFCQFFDIFRQPILTRTTPLVPLLIKPATTSTKLPIPGQVCKTSAISKIHVHFENRFCMWWWQHPGASCTPPPNRFTRHFYL